MIFVDTSAYLSLLNPSDNHHQSALKQAKDYGQLRPITSQAVLGQVLTVGSMRFHRPKTIKFVEKIVSSSTLVILETDELTTAAFELLKKTKSKNVSWVDCYSQAIINAYQIPQVFTFDRHFAQLAKLI